MFIQCWYRRRHARRGAAATKLQAALRMHLAGRSFRHKRRSALVIQVSIIPAANPLFAYSDTCRVSVLKTEEEPQRVHLHTEPSLTENLCTYRHTGVGPGRCAQQARQRW